MTSLRHSYENTPTKRIAFAAYQLFSRMFDEWLHSRTGPQYPHAHDLEVHLEPYVDLEIVRAMIRQTDDPTPIKELRQLESMFVDRLRQTESRTPDA